MTLTEVSYYSRKFAPVIVIFLLVLLIFYFAFQLMVVYLGANKAKPTPTPTVAPQVSLKTEFGNLPPITLPDTSSSAGFTYVMDTVDGKPITATESATIYLMPASTSSFGFISRIYLMAQANGIDTERIKHQLQGKEAAFTDGLHTFKVDITNFNFIYQYTMTKENTQFQPDRANTSGIENAAIDYLRKMDRYPEELAQGKKNIVYLNYNHDNNTMAIVSGLEAANMAEVDFYRPDLNNLPVSTPKYFNSPNYVVVAFTKEGYKVIRAQVAFHAKSKEQFGFYPLKTGVQAFEALKQGKGIIVSGKPGDATNPVRIKTMNLSYLDTEAYQQYLQPVYVFLGDGNFVAYVPAVQDNLIGN